MKSCQKFFFPEMRFGGFSHLDGTIQFYLHVNALLNPQSMLLDVGCGRGEYYNDPVEIRKSLRILRGKVSRVIGLDVNPVAAENQTIDEFRLLESPSSPWPLDDASVDVIVADWVLEHVANPDIFFSEAWRVLKEGGYLCIRTTNAWGYVALMTRIIPEAFHNRLIRWIQKARKEEDIFPTVYRCNTIPKIKHTLKKHGYSGVVFSPIGTPAYLNFSCIVYFFGILYERFSPQWLRHTILVFAQKT